MKEADLLQKHLFLFLFFMILAKYIIAKVKGTSFNLAWKMRTATPLTCDILVSYAERDGSAFETQIHSYNLYDLLDQFQ